MPANQIRAWERWDSDGKGEIRRAYTWRHENPAFDPPALVSNIRELL